MHGRGCNGTGWSTPIAGSPRQARAGWRHTSRMTDRSDFAPQSLETATALPARCYVGTESLERDLQRVFARSWQFIAHASQLAGSGDHVVGRIGHLPVIAVRGEDGEIHAFHNVCRHRAGPLAQCDGIGAKALRCRYHGWTYTLNGQLRSAPEMKDAQGFDIGGIHLPRLAVRVWQGVVFVAVGEANAPDFESFVDGIAARIGDDRGLEGYGHHHRVGYDIDCN